MISPEMIAVILTVGGVIVERIYDYGRDAKTVDVLETKDEEQEGRMDKIIEDQEKVDEQVWGAIKSVRDWQDLHLKEATEIRIKMERDIGGVQLNVARFEEKLESLITGVKEIKDIVNSLRKHN